MLAFVLCMWSLCLWAQDAAVGEQKKTAGKSVTVSGTVIEEDTNEPAFSASVVLLKPVDSTLVAGASSGLDGKVFHQKRETREIHIQNYFGGV